MRVQSTAEIVHTSLYVVPHFPSFLKISQKIRFRSTVRTYVQKIVQYMQNVLHIACLRTYDVRVSSSADVWY